MIGMRASEVRRAYGFLAAALLGAVLLAACAERELARKPEPEKPVYCPMSGPGSTVVASAESTGPWLSEATTIRVASAAEILRRFDRGAAARGKPGASPLPVPEVLVANLPSDLASMRSVTQRKRAFIAAVLPLAIKAHDEILAERGFVRQVEACRRAGLPLNPASVHRLAALVKVYGSDGDTRGLLRRLDVVPLSLMLAQSAVESGWGTSRFALKGNALFGQRTTNAKRGMKANDATEGTRVLVAAFPNLLESVRSYLRNLNTHPAYLEFRLRRAALRAVDGIVTGMALADTLEPYSVRGPAYIRDLKVIIRHNGYDNLDHLGLEVAQEPDTGRLWAVRY